MMHQQNQFHYVLVVQLVTSLEFRFWEWWGEQKVHTIKDWLLSGLIENKWTFIPLCIYLPSCGQGLDFDGWDEHVWVYSDMAFDSTDCLPKALVTLPKCRLLLKYLQTNFVALGGWVGEWHGCLVSFWMVNLIFLWHAMLVLEYVHVWVSIESAC